jgi:2,3-bisphosphoglycerate-independent phosphoglycerate mutase
MFPLEVLKDLILETPSKIVFVVIDGVGGLPVEGKTELEAAKKPNLDRIAREGLCGLTIPVYPGITPGSGPGHLALFGYDPLRYQIKRGILEALGLGMEVKGGEVVARGNFATFSEDGRVLDRRAQRIPTEENRRLCEKLRKAIPEVQGVKIEIESGKEHRFVVKFSGEGLSDLLSDTDPQKEGLKPLEPIPLEERAERMASIVKEFSERAREVLKGEYPANGILLRGFSQMPEIPSLSDLYKLKPACIASYPMYKGIARLLGMEVLKTGESIGDLFEALRLNFHRGYDFFYVHIKETDSRGEDGDFEGKVRVIEELDRAISVLFELSPEVIVLCSDHSTPSLLKGHSWHPCPFALRSPYERADEVQQFTEMACSRGALGVFRAVEVMPLVLASALKLRKFGA